MTRPEQTGRRPTFMSGWVRGALGPHAATVDSDMRGHCVWCHNPLVTWEDSTDPAREWEYTAVAADLLGIPCLFVHYVTDRRTGHVELEASQVYPKSHRRHSDPIGGEDALVKFLEDIWEVHWATYHPLRPPLHRTEWAGIPESHATAIWNRTGGQPWA